MHCPHCLAPHEIAPPSACARCGGAWFAPEAGARSAALRRFAGRGPPTLLSCPVCRVALKAFDVPGHQHEGDLFWGHESARAAGTFVAEGCPRCGGAWVEAADLARAGGAASARDGLARLGDELAG